MGNIQVRRLIKRKKNDDDPRKSAKIEEKERISEYRKLRRIWMKVDENNTYYGFAMCTVLFRNHPQYTKYFEDETLPEFVQEAKVKKKFSSICDTLCTLFVDYQYKPSKRDYLIGYIAMVHKDMGLTLKDLDDFLSDMTETLVTELPDLMTEEYVAAQKKYFGQLSVRVMKFMEQQNKQQVRLLRPSVSETKRCLVWKVDPQMQMMYGYPVKYWLHKRRYWEYRRAIWASLEADLLGSSLTDTRSMNVERRSIIVRRPQSRRRLSSKRRRPNSSDTNDRTISYVFS